MEEKINEGQNKINKSDETIALRFVIEYQSQNTICQHFKCLLNDESLLVFS